jgi:hypothetical protein
VTLGTSRNWASWPLADVQLCVVDHAQLRAQPSQARLSGIGIGGAVLVVSAVLVALVGF